MLRSTAAACLLFVLSACSPPQQAAVTPEAETPAELAAHGEYLVTRVAMCGDCHTPWVDGRPDPNRPFQGGPTGMSAPLSEYAPALAGVPDYFTDEEFAQILQTGSRPNGSTPKAPMPAFRFNERDARAITAYLNTIPPAPE